MRIPWYIVTPLALLIFIAVLWLGSRQYNFTEAPNEAELEETRQTWQAKHPTLPSRTTPIQEKLQTPPRTEEKVPVSSPPTPSIAAGDLGISPALDHYIAQAELGAEALQRLAQKLEQSGHSQHALLAWERIIDSSEAQHSTLLAAYDAGQRLRQQLPVWNADSTLNQALIIHIHVPEKWKKDVSSLLDTLSQDLALASSQQIAPQLLIKTAPQKVGFPPPPVNIWLSGAGQNSRESPKLTFHLKADTLGLTDNAPNPVDKIKAQLYRAVYQSISAELENHKLVRPPAALDTQQAGSDALIRQLTRLQWQQLATALNQPTPTSTSP